MEKRRKNKRRTYESNNISIAKCPRVDMFYINAKT